MLQWGKDSVSPMEQHPSSASPPGTSPKMTLTNKRVGEKTRYYTTHQLHHMETFTEHLPMKHFSGAESSFPKDFFNCLMICKHRVVEPRPYSPVPKQAQGE